MAYCTIKKLYSLKLNNKTNKLKKTKKKIIKQSKTKRNTNKERTKYNEQNITNKRKQIRIRLELLKHSFIKLL